VLEGRPKNGKRHMRGTLSREYKINEKGELTSNDYASWEKYHSFWQPKKFRFGGQQFILGKKNNLVGEEQVGPEKKKRRQRTIIWKSWSSLRC